VIAYTSLLVTDFRGFRDFGVIGGAGILLCWISAFTVLPASLAVLERRGRIRARREPALGRLLARLLPRNLTAVAVVGGAVTLAAGGVAVHYLATDPFEYNWENLRADSPEAMTGRHWMHQVDLAFGHGLASGFVIAVDRPEQAPVIERLLRAHAESKAHPGGELFRKVSTIEGALPRDQPAKLAVLADLRGILTDRKTLDALSDEERARRSPPAPPGRHPGGDHPAVRREGR